MQYSTHIIVMYQYILTRVDINVSQFMAMVVSIRDRVQLQLLNITVMPNNINEWTHAYSKSHAIGH